MYREIGYMSMVRRLCVECVLRAMCWGLFVVCGGALRVLGGVCVVCMWWGRECIGGRVCGVRGLCVLGGLCVCMCAVCVVCVAVCVLWVVRVFVLCDGHEHVSPVALLRFLTLLDVGPS